MSEAKYHIETADQLNRKFRDAYDCATLLIQQGGVMLTVGKPTRSDKQNRMLHAMLGDLEKQADWAGQKWPAGVWKRMAVAAWLRESGEKPIMVPSLDGCGIDVIYDKTSTMTVRQLNSLIEWLFALGAELGVNWTDPEVRSQYAAAEMSKGGKR